MTRRQLGRSGIAAPRLGLGCATFGREINEADAFAIMDYAVAHGITLFDTAEAYGGGQARAYRRDHLGVDDTREVSGEMHSSERIVGRWLCSGGARSGVVLLTKVTRDFTRTHVRQALEASLDRLQTDRTDLYLYHAFDPQTPVAESAAAMREVVAAGLARAGGCSNYSGSQLAEAMAEGRPFEVVESNYNLVTRGFESDVLPAARKYECGVLTYSPLAAGFLTGKYTPDRAAFPKGSRFDVIPGHADIYFSETGFRIVEQLRVLAATSGVPAARLAIAWVLANPAVDTVLVGARTTAHLDNALAALRGDVPEQWIAAAGRLTGAAEAAG